MYLLPYRLLLLLPGLLALPTAAQAPLLTLTSPEATVGGTFGEAVAGVPDADGDGRGDLLIGANSEDGAGTGAGQAYLFSGATGTLLHTLATPNPTGSGGFGEALAGITDHDGDGRGDLLVGAPRENSTTTRTGRAYVFSGASGAMLVALTSPNAEFGGGFGGAVASVPDTDGDGLDDLLIGAPFEDGGAAQAGRAYLFSGAGGALLHTLDSPNVEADGSFGISVSGVPDADGDGRGDLLIGADLEDAGAVNGAGRAYLFSGATGALLHTLVSPAPEVIGRFGFSVAGLADADGRGDLLIGALLEDGGAQDAGAAHLFSGTTGTLIRTITSPNASPSSRFGESVAGVPDADGDGVDDLLVGARHEDGGGPADAGRTYFFSGATGTLLQTLESTNPETLGQFGISVAGVPDANGDGRGDLLVGTFLEDGGATNAGRAYLFSGSSDPVAIEEDIRADAFALLRSHPNPASRSTEITFRLTRPAPIRLALYDMLGREIAVLTEGMRGAGTHALRLDATRLPYGTYLLQLTTDQHTTTQQFSVLQ